MLLPSLAVAVMAGALSPSLIIVRTLFPDRVPKLANALPRRVMLGKKLVPARCAARLRDQLPGGRGRLDVAGRDEPHHDQHSRQQLLRISNAFIDKTVIDERLDRTGQPRVEAGFASELKNVN